MNFAVPNIILRNNKIKNENRQLVLMIVLFLFSPFVIFLYALFSYQNRNSQIIIVLFTGLFGYNMIAESDSMDLSRIHEILFKYNQFSLIDIIKSYYNTMFNTYNSTFTKTESVGDSPDLYTSFLGVLVSRITTNGKIFMAVFGLVYGYVFVKSMQKFIEIQPNSVLSNIPVLCAAFMMPLGQLAGVRYGTASYLFIWGVLGIINSNNARYYFLILLACLTHFSFIVPSFLFILYQLFSLKLSETKIKIAFLIYIISFFFPDLILNLLSNSFLKDLLGVGIQNKANEYTNGELNKQMVSDYYSNAAWYIIYPFRLAVWYVYGSVFVKYFPSQNINHSFKTNKILLWVLVLLSFSNFSKGAADLGNRLLMVSAVFFFYYLLSVYNENHNQPIIKNLVLISLFFLLLKIIFEIRFIIEYTTPIFFYGSIFHIINDTATMSLWTYISDFIFDLSHRKA